MAWRLYLAPAETVADATGPIRRPKYVMTYGGDPWAGMDYGSEALMLVAADLAAANHADVTARADVRTVPANLDANPTAAQVTAVQNTLEAANLPAGWVTTALTWRQIVRTVAGFFQFMQRLQFVSGRDIGAGRLFDGQTLASRINQLPQAWRTALSTTATSLGYDTSSLSGTTTLRVALKAMADQWGDRPIVIGGITL